MSVILGVFSNRDNAENAISELESIGYDTKDMSILMKNNQGAVETTNGANEVAKDTMKGVGTGALVGGLLGLLAGTVIPGIGALLVGGPLAVALGLTGAAATTVSGVATGAVAGGIIGALTGTFGLTKEEAKTYETRINEGGILVAVPADRADVEEVQGIMIEYGADNVRFVKGNTSVRETRNDYVRQPIGMAGGRARRRVM